MPAAPSPASPRGRPAAASRQDVIDAAMHRYLSGRRIDVQAIAGELGLGRVTIYRWFGSGEELVGGVLVGAAEPLLADARDGARGRGARLLLSTFDRFNRGLAGAPALRTFVSSERDAARIITSGKGPVQPRIVAMITALIEDEVRTGTYDPPVEAGTPGPPILRPARAVPFNDTRDPVRDLARRRRGPRAR